MASAAWSGSVQFTRAGRSWTALILAGLATAALCYWPTLAVDYINAVHPMGDTAAWRQALFDMSWRRWEFWLFTAVLSWALVAFAEEAFFRGYCQRRLAEDWGDAAAIAGVTGFFLFSHVQYLSPNAYNAAKVASLLALGLGAGVVFAWTRSLVPSVVAHAISNVPLTSFWQGIVLIVLVLGAVLTARQGVSVLKRVFSAPASRGLACSAWQARDSRSPCNASMCWSSSPLAWSVLAALLERRDRKHRATERSAQHL